MGRGRGSADQNVVKWSHFVLSMQLMLNSSAYEVKDGVINLSMLFFFVSVPYDFYQKVNSEKKMNTVRM